MPDNSWERTASESIARHNAEMRAADEAERAKHPLFWKLWDAYWISRLLVFVVAVLVAAIVFTARWFTGTT